MLQKPRVGSAAHDDAADACHKGVIAFLAALEAVELKQPGQVVVRSGDVAVEGRSNKVLKTGHAAQPSYLASGCLRLRVTAFRAEPELAVKGHPLKYGMMRYRPNSTARPQSPKHTHASERMRRCEVSGASPAMAVRRTPNE